MTRTPPLPPKDRRFGAPDLQDDEQYVRSAVDQVDRLLGLGVLGPSASVLDFGCGQGRFAYGLLERPGSFVSYLGLDTHEASIDWCRTEITTVRPDMRFEHYAAHNARYNPAAEVRPPLPVASGEYDLAFANSVFSHMLEADTRHYLRELARVVAPGHVYLTAFLEVDVPRVEENPAGYLNEGGPQTPLHRVRYEQSHFMGLARQAGFEVVWWKHRGEVRSQQSSLLLATV